MSKLCVYFPRLCAGITDGKDFLTLRPDAKVPASVRHAGCESGADAEMREARLIMTAQNMAAAGALPVPPLPQVSPFETAADLSPAEWDNLITDFGDAAFEQTSAFRGAVWGEGRVRRIAVFEKGVAVGMALATLFRPGSLGRGLAYVKFGPLWRRKDRAPDPRHLDAIISALVNEFVDRGRLSLTVFPLADPRHADVVANALRRHGFECRPVEDRDRYLVDVSLSSKDQLASLGGKWRYNLKKAQKADLAIAVEEGPQALAEFAAIFEAMEKRKNYANDSWKAFRDALAAGVPEGIAPAIILVREKGQAIAGAVIGFIGDTAYYLYGATDDRAVALKAGYVMQWWIIGWLSGRNLKWYDLGGASGEDGLRQFKKGLTGKSGATAALPGEFTLCRDPLSRLLASAILTVRMLKKRFGSLAKLREALKSSPAKEKDRDAG